MALTIIDPPASEPVDLAELKLWSRVDHDDDNSLIMANGEAAREYIETWLGRQLVTATWKLTERCFPIGRITIPRPPLQSIDSVQYRDTDGNLQTLDPSAYLVDAASDPGTVEPTTAWPRTGSFPDAVQITFTAGYGDSVDVPSKIKTAIMGLAGHWYEQREPIVVGGTVASVPHHVTALVQQAKVWVRT